MRRGKAVGEDPRSLSAILQRTYNSAGEWNPYVSSRPKGLVAINNSGSLIRILCRNAQASAGAFDPANSSDTRWVGGRAARTSAVLITPSNDPGEIAASGPTRPLDQT